MLLQSPLGAEALGYIDILMVGRGCGKFHWSPFPTDFIGGETLGWPDLHPTPRQPGPGSMVDGWTSRPRPPASP